MMNTLGKHTNDHMVSFYVYSPERYAVEFGCNGLRVDAEEPTYEITQGAFWRARLPVLCERIVRVPVSSLTQSAGGWRGVRRWAGRLSRRG
jgi:hypothetical protein